MLPTPVSRAARAHYPPGMSFIQVYTMTIRIRMGRLLWGAESSFHLAAPLALCSVVPADRVLPPGAAALRACRFHDALISLCLSHPAGFQAWTAWPHPPHRACWGSSWSASGWHTGQRACLPSLRFTRRVRAEQEPHHGGRLSVTASMRFMLGQSRAKCPSLPHSKQDAATGVASRARNVRGFGETCMRSGPDRCLHRSWFTSWSLGAWGAVPPRLGIQGGCAPLRAWHRWPRPTGKLFHPTAK